MTADWDRASQQAGFKRPRYDDYSSSASSTSPNSAYHDAWARQPFEGHHRVPSNHSQTSSKGKIRDTLPPISPHPSYSVPMAASASLPPIQTVSPPPQHHDGSPNRSSRSVNTSPNSHTSKHAQVPPTADSVASNSRVAASPSPTRPHFSAASSAHAAGAEPKSTAPPITTPIPAPSVSQSRQTLVLDYASSEPDPEELLVDIDSLPMSTVTQQTKGAVIFHRFLQAIARMSQGRAMAHALAAMLATQQDTLASAAHDAGADGSNQTSPRMNQASGGTSTDKSVKLLELANRHHLAAIKALQTQQQPSRRRRFSVIETSSSSGADELPIGSNAAAMIMIILACSSVNKSMMLPSYFNQCEQFLADAVEHVSTHRLFPSVSGEPIVGTPEEPPVLPPENLSNYGNILFLGTIVGLYECYLSQYTAVADWDYNPARLRRLLPFNWADSDADLFDRTRKTVAETTFSVSMVTLELVIESLDTMRKFKRAEAVAYGNRQSSRSEAEDGVAALDSLALREELGLLIRDLEAGTFWKGSAKILSDADQLLVLDSLNRKSCDTAVAETSEEDEPSSRMPPPPSAGDETIDSAITTAFASGDLFVSTGLTEAKEVNRLRLANHLFRNALLVDLYVSVFNRSPSSLAVRELVSRSVSLLGAVPDKTEHGLLWPVMVLGSFAEGPPERGQVRNFLKRAQWKGTAGPSVASDVLERVWAQDSASWRESVAYFGSPYIC